jgi:hypothetical protein
MAAAAIAPDAPAAPTAPTLEPAAPAAPAAPTLEPAAAPPSALEPAASDAPAALTLAPVQTSPPTITEATAATMANIEAQINTFSQEKLRDNVIDSLFDSRFKSGDRPSDVMRKIVSEISETCDFSKLAAEKTERLVKARDAVVNAKRGYDESVGILASAIAVADTEVAQAKVSKTTGAIV